MGGPPNLHAGLLLLWPLFGDSTYRDSLRFIGIMEKNMETTVVDSDNIGIMENEMETTLMGRVWDQGFKAFICVNTGGLRGNTHLSTSDYISHHNNT